MSFLAQYGSVIAFYIIIITLIYVNRKKFDFEAKLIALYRTKIGIKLMHKWGEKARRLIKTLAKIGIYIGFLGMAFTIYMILDGLFKLVFVPEAPATFAPVIPGVKIPGVEIFVPFWYGIIALFITIVVHEFSHGVVASAYKLKVKNSGFVMFGPLPGAFVEPDEKQLRKASPKAQLAVYAAGPFSNILLTIILIILFGFLPLFFAAGGNAVPEGVTTFTKYTSIVNFANIREGMYEPTGLQILTIANESAAFDAGLPPNTVITTINDHHIQENMTAFANEIVSFTNLTPNETITFSNDNQTWTIITKPTPDNANKGRIGITFDTFFITEKNPEAIQKYGALGFGFIEIMFQQIFWIILLSSGIGLANLLPLGPVDGGRMLLTTLQKYMKKERAQKIWGKVSTVVFISVIILVLAPILKNLLF